MARRASAPIPQVGGGLRGELRPRGPGDTICRCDQSQLQARGPSRATSPTSRPGDPHWFRSSSSIGTVKGGQAAPPRRDLSHLARDEQACGRAILRKRSTVGFHSAGGQVHAGAVGHRRRARRCAVQPLPWAEERSPAPRARPGRSSTEGPEPPRVLRPYGRSTLCTTVCSLSAGGQVHAGAVGHQRRAGRCAMQPLPWAEERSPAPQPHPLCGDPAVGPPCSQPRRRRNWQHDCETTLAGRFTGRTAPHHRRCGAVSEHQHEQKEEASASSLMLLPNSYWREDNQGT